MTINQLTDQLVTDGGAIVSTGECSEMEIAEAQAVGRFSCREDGMGFIRRTKEWLALQLAREKAHPNTDNKYSMVATSEQERLKTPAEAARYQFKTYEPKSGFRADWQAVAQAAIDTYLAQVAEELPTIAEMLQASEKEMPMRSIHAIFSSHFAKLQAERDTLKGNVDMAKVAIDGARVMMEELQARINMIADERDELRQKLAEKDAAIAGLKKQKHLFEQKGSG